MDLDPSSSLKLYLSLSLGKKTMRSTALSTAKRALKRIPLLVALNERFRGQDRDIARFLANFFRQPGQKRIVQVGANDGVMSDPLRPFLRQPGSYVAVLVEPLPFYAKKLAMLYEGRSDVEVVNAAAGSQEAALTLYYIPPEVADRMNGDGPANGWAHGQGSFDRETIVHWINQNSFRGPDYVRQIPEFIASIASLKVPVRPLQEITPMGENTLLVIDAQGFELEVLNGVDWASPPQYVMYEDDLGEGSPVDILLRDRGFRYVCGRTDKVYERAR